jgi:hypothetical protein
MRSLNIVARLVVVLAAFAGSASEIRAQLVVPMTEEETMRLEQLASDLSECSNPDCAAMGNAMG